MNATMLSRVRVVSKLLVLFSTAAACSVSTAAAANLHSANVAATRSTQGDRYMFFFSEVPFLTVLTILNKIEY